MFCRKQKLKLNANELNPAVALVVIEHARRLSCAMQRFVGIRGDDALESGFGRSIINRTLF